MAKISVVLNTYNAGEYLDTVLNSLAEFDEIVVCDMESTDNTVSIAKNHGCRIITFERGENRICEPARDFAIHSAKHEWVLVVDADEIVPDSLRRYLYELIDCPEYPDGLLIPRSNLFLGKRYDNTTDYQLRFMRKDRASWPPQIHSRPQIDGTVEQIPKNRKDLYLIHLDNSSLVKRFNKLNCYTDYELHRRKTKKYGMAKFFFRPAWFFFRSYFIHGGCRDGLRGIIKAYYAMIYQIMLMSKVVEDKYYKEQK